MVVAVIDAMYRSAQEGRRVEVPTAKEVLAGHLEAPARQGGTKRQKS